MLDLVKRKGEEGLSKRKTAMEHGINASALQKCLKAGNGHSFYVTTNQILQ
jgi:hypothetical protein